MERPLSVPARADLSRKLAALEKQLTGRLDVHEAAIVKVLQDLMQILNPPLPPHLIRHNGNRVLILAIIAIRNYLTSFVPFS